MAHVPLALLTEKVQQAALRVEVGGRYAHYKDPAHTYRVLALAVLEATDEVAVVYAAEYADNLSFVRPLESWVETVSFEGREVARYQKLARCVQP